jgi:hypothetical protein
MKQKVQEKSAKGTEIQVLGSGPTHVRVSGLLYELEGFLANTVGSKENNLRGLGGKLLATPIPIYRRVIVIDGTRIKWWRTPK